MGKIKPSTGIVHRCVPRQDGGFLIVTRNKLSATSPVEVPEGQLITIRDGRVEGKR